LWKVFTDIGSSLYGVYAYESRTKWFIVCHLWQRSFLVLVKQRGAHNTNILALVYIDGVLYIKLEMCNICGGQELA